jgi:hypothetical protein
VKRSLFLELLDEEATIPKGGKGAFSSVGDLAKALQARAALVRKMDAAKAGGQLTQEQYDQLVSLNRKHSLSLQ